MEARDRFMDDFAEARVKKREHRGDGARNEGDVVLDWMGRFDMDSSDEEMALRAVDVLRPSAEMECFCIISRSNLWRCQKCFDARVPTRMEISQRERSRPPLTCGECVKLVTGLRQCAGCEEAEAMFRQEESKKVRRNGFGASLDEEMLAVAGREAQEDMREELASLRREMVRSKAVSMSGGGRPIVMNALTDNVGVLNLDKVNVSSLYSWLRKVRKAHKWFEVDGYDWLETKVSGRSPRTSWTL